MRTRVAQGFAVTLAVGFLLFACGRRGETPSGSPAVPADLAKVVEGATSFDDVFEKVRVIPLALDDHSLLGTCSQILSVGNRLIAVDQRISRRVVEFDLASGQFLHSVGCVGSGPGQYQEPTWVAVDSAGRVLILDGNAGKLLRYSAEGTFAGAVDLASAGVLASRIEVGADGLYYLFTARPSRQKNREAHLVAVVDSSGNVRRHLVPWQPSGTAALYAGGGMCFGPRGLLFVTGPFDPKVRVWKTTGEHLATITDHLDALPSPFTEDLLAKPVPTRELLKLLHDHVTPNGLFHVEPGLLILTSASGKAYCLSFFDSGSLRVLNGAVCVTPENSGSLTSPVLGSHGRFLFMVEEGAPSPGSGAQPGPGLNVVVFQPRMLGE